MRILVRYLETRFVGTYCVVDTFDGDNKIVINPVGVLEIKTSTDVVIKAYGPGTWIDAKINS